jgi:hypothetical protein
MEIKQRKKQSSLIKVQIGEQIIFKKTAVETFLDVIEYVANIVTIDTMEIDLHFITKDPSRTFQSERFDSTGMYRIDTNTSTERKKELLERIFNLYKIEAEVSIIEKDKAEDERKYWIYSPGNNGDMWEEFYKLGIMALGWELGDLTNLSKEEIAEKLQGDTDVNKKNDTVANFDFKSNISLGDIIIVKKGRNELIGYGEVISDYYYDDSREIFKSCRKVNWIKKGSWKTENTLVLKTLTDITKYDNSLKVENDGIKYYQTLMDIMDDKTVSISFIYNDNLVILEDKNVRKLNNRIINWLFLNEYKFEGEYHKTQWRKIYTDDEKNELIKIRSKNLERSSSFNQNNFYLIETNRYILKNSYLEYSKKMLELHGCTDIHDDNIEISEEEFEMELKDDVKNPFGGQEDTSSLCITGESGSGKSYRIEETLKSEKHEYIFENYDATATGLLTTYSPSENKYVINNIGQFIVEATKNPDKNYTIILDEVQKEDFLAKINNELFHCLSSKRNGGIRYIPTNKSTDHLFDDLENRNGRRIVTNNVGFILITSKADVVHNDDIKNRLDIINLTIENRDLDFDITSLLELKLFEENEYSIE